MPLLISLILRNSVLQYEWGIEITYFAVDLIHIYIVGDYIDKDENICALWLVKMDNFRDAKNAFLAQFSLIGCRTHITACECIKIKKNFNSFMVINDQRTFARYLLCLWGGPATPQHNHICLKWFYSLHELRDRNKRKERI